MPVADDPLWKEWLTAGERRPVTRTALRRAQTEAPDRKPGGAEGIKAGPAFTEVLQRSAESILETYLNATRAELLFARGAIFIEGDAEEALLPIFASSLGHSLDELGISVCNVGGVNFRPYVKLAEALKLPYSVITDWDPLDGTEPPLGKKRTLDFWQDMLAVRGQPLLTTAQLAPWEAMDHAAFSAGAAKSSIFLNDQTFEVSIANTPTLLNPLLDILSEQDFGSVRSRRIAAWRAGTAVDAAQLLAMIADIGKGRLGARLSKKAVGLKPPAYIESAINTVVGLIAHV